MRCANGGAEADQLMRAIAVRLDRGRSATAQRYGLPAARYRFTVRGHDFDVAAQQEGPVRAGYEDVARLGRLGSLGWPG